MRVYIYSSNLSFDQTVSAISNNPDTSSSVFWVIAIVASTPIWAFVLRIILCFVTRSFGLANPDHFHLWLFFPWRWASMKLIRLMEWFEQTFTMGRKATAKWTGFLQRACLIYKPGRVLYGRQQWFGLPMFQPVGEDCERHITMIAGTGSGKTTLLITMLSLHTGTIFAVDPKGQIFRALKDRCGQGGHGILSKKPLNGCQRVCAALDPYGVCENHRSQCWNVIDELEHAAKRHGRDAVPRYAMKIAEGMIVSNPNENNPFFSNSARMFVQALLLYVYITMPPDERHIVRFREFLTQGLPPQGPIKDPMDMLFFEMEQCQEWGGTIAGAATSLRTSSDKARGDVLGTAREQTKWLDLPEIRRISTCSDFALGDLKTGALSLFVCAPATDIRSTLSGWFRLLAVLGLYIFENIPGRLDHPCYFALDEMPSLGAIDAVETAAPLMRGYGVRLLCITQGIPDLSAIYPKTWQKFLGNADAVYWLGLGVADAVTPSELARILGAATRKEKIGGGLFAREKRRYQKVERPLIYPEQISRMLRGQNIIVTRYDQRPLRLKAVPYYLELPITHYAPDPEHGDRPLRALSRKIARLCVQPRGKRSRLSYDEALSVFGLSPGYHRDDVDNRYALLQHNCARSHEFALAIKHARSLLIRKAKL